ncbi:hypothetical protein [Aquamicrobium sp. LC103]|uniref:hypothetical protein n=1 Tax=Aquamicrobium sp. LC103 TaxID=1120658 RepID=UPI00063EABB7|nr:hypothetical protein [Aquamicrobium sp. LC103]TKT78395.1 hypothetical protein XW59_012325 [Aquamicrobium sp. LC103]
MARPKLGDSETERLHMKITKAELQAIEDWQFAHRISSKSEAIRRLCKIALFLEAEFEQIIEVTTDGVTITADLFRQGVDDKRLYSQPELDDALFTRDEVLDIIDEASDRAYDAFAGVQGLHELVTAIYEAVRPYTEAQTISKGDEQAQRRIEQANEAVEAADRRRAQSDENRYLGIWVTSLSDEEEAAYESLSEEEQDAYVAKRVEELKAEEAANPEIFAEKYGVRRRFWEIPGWEQRVKQRTKANVGRTGEQK